MSQACRGLHNWFTRELASPWTLQEASTDYDRMVLEEVGIFFSHLVLSQCLPPLVLVSGVWRRQWAFSVGPFYFRNKGLRFPCLTWKPLPSRVVVGKSNPEEDSLKSLSLVTFEKSIRKISARISSECLFPKTFLTGYWRWWVNHLQKIHCT